jgi:hypothetical protein
VSANLKLGEMHGLVHSDFLFDVVLGGFETMNENLPTQPRSNSMLINHLILFIDNLGTDRPRHKTK